jgi:hypothetical protein
MDGEHWRRGGDLWGVYIGKMEAAQASGCVLYICVCSVGRILSSAEVAPPFGSDQQSNLKMDGDDFAKLRDCGRSVVQYTVQYSATEELLY